MSNKIITNYLNSDEMIDVMFCFLFFAAARIALAVCTGQNELDRKHAGQQEMTRERKTKGGLVFCNSLTLIRVVE